MKRVRKKFGKGPRYFHCGEYGSKNKRPHYHAILFNLDFNDKYFWRKTDSGHPSYRSPTLEKLWPFGHAEIGAANFETAAYVARYILKKVSGPLAESHYESLNEKTGEITDLLPEYTTMSRRPGIGRAWLEKYTGDVYPADRVIIKQKGEYVEQRPPKYYDNIFSLAEPEIFEDIQFIRRKKALQHVKDGTFERLRVREQLQLSKLEKLTRSYEHGEQTLRSVRFEK